MGMLKHCIGRRKEENNNGGFDDEIEYDPRKDRSISIASTTRSTLALPDKMERRLSGMKARAYSRQSLGSRSTRTVLTTYSCSCRSDRRSRMSGISTTSDFPKQLEKQALQKRPESMRACKICSYTFAILVAVLCLLSGLAHFYITYFPTDFYLNHGDVKLVKYSSYFCASVLVTGSATPIRLTALSNVKTSRTKIAYKLFQTLQLEPGIVWSRSFYLMAKSSLVLTVESNDLFEVLFFEDEHTFNIWSDRMNAETYMKKEICCANKKIKKGVYTLTAEKESRYYIVFYRSTVHAGEIYFRASIDFNRTSLDFSSTVSTCVAVDGKFCTIDLRFNSEDQVAVEIPRKNNPTVIPMASKVTWECKGRVWFYTVAFGVSYLIFILILVLLYFCYKQGFFHVCIRRTTCYKNMMKNKRSNSLCMTDYNNEGCDDLSRSPSMLSLQWDSECRNHSFENHHDGHHIPSSRHGSVAGFTCRRCSTQYGQINCRCGQPLDRSISTIATIYADRSPRRHRLSTEDNKMNTTDSGISVTYCDTNSVPLSNGIHRKTIVEEDDQTRSPRKKRTMSRSLSLPHSIHKSPPESERRSRALSEVSKYGNDDIRTMELFTSLSTEEALSPNKLAETAQKLYRKESSCRVDVHDIVLSSDEVFI